MTRLFVIHPSDLLTDFEPNGDGIIAYGFIAGLAARNYEIDVAYETAKLRQPLPSNVRMHVIQCRIKHGPLRRIEYMFRVRLLFEKIHKARPVNLLLQLNPVFAGLSLSMVGSGIPMILGTYVARWPDEDGGRLRLVKRVLLGAVSVAQQHFAKTLLVTTILASQQRISPLRSAKAKVKFLKHGVDTTIFRSRSVRNQKEFGRILICASLMRRKGLFTLIEAFAEIRSNFPNAQLIVAGDGDQRTALQERVAELDIERHVHFLGNVARSEIPSLMHEADIYCLPSFGEPYATSVIEAMAAGLPVIVSDSGGVRELVDSCGSIQVATGSVQSLSAGLSKLLGDQRLSELMGMHNRSRAVKEFDWNSVIDSLELIYAECLTDPTTGPSVVARN